MYQPQFIWESGIWGPIPRWLSLPDVAAIESVARKQIRLSAGDHISVTFFAEGAFNKLFTITVSNSGSTLGTPQYIFRATAPVEPFFKIAGEVATLSYLQEHTSIPVPRIIAHSSTSDNEVGCEWILMEKIPGVALADVWRDIDLETKNKVTRSVVGYVRQLRDLRRCFTGIGTLYFREEIDTLKAPVRVVRAKDEKYVLGPLVTPYMFAGGRKLRVARDLGPYSNDAEYIAALTASELEDMKLLLSPDARLHSDFDEDLADEAENIILTLNQLQQILPALFPSKPRNFALHHHDLSLRNILVDLATHQITGIVDWECVGTRPHWEDTYPQFLRGPEITEEEPLAPGDTDPIRVECWENWEKVKLRLVFDKELGETRHDDDGRDEIRRGFRKQLDIVGISTKMTQDWMNEYGDRCTNVLSEIS